MKHAVWVAALWLALPAIVWAQPAPRDAIEGYWRTADGGAIVHITVDGGHFPARIVWLKQDHYPADDAQGMGGQAIVDRHNPDPDKQDRPVVGLRLIKDLDYHVLDNGQARWEHGRVYNPDNGKWYHCYLRMADHDHLKLHGYIGLPILGHTTTWTRVAAPEPSSSAE